MKLSLIGGPILGTRTDEPNLLVLWWSCCCFCATDTAGRSFEHSTKPLLSCGGDRCSEDIIFVGAAIMKSTRRGSMANQKMTNPNDRNVPKAGAFSGMSTTDGQQGKRVGQVVAQKFHPVKRPLQGSDFIPEEEEEEDDITEDAWTDDGEDKALDAGTVTTNYTPTIAGSYRSKSKQQNAVPKRRSIQMPAPDRRYTAAELQHLTSLGRGPLALHAHEETPHAPSPRKNEETRQARLKRIGSTERILAQRGDADSASVPSSEGGAQQIPLGLERDKYGRRASVHIEALKKMNPKGFVEPHTLDDPMDDDDIDCSAPLPETLESFIHSVATPRCSLVNSFRHLDDGCVLLDIVQSVVGEPVPDVDRNSTNTERIRHALLFLGRKDGWQALPELLRKWDAADQWTNHSSGVSTELVRYLMRKQHRASLPVRPSVNTERKGTAAAVTTAKKPPPARPPFCAGKNANGILGNYTTLDDTRRFDAKKAEQKKANRELMGSIRDMEKIAEKMRSDLVEERIVIDKKERRIIRARGKQDTMTKGQQILSNEMKEKIGSAKDLILEYDASRQKGAHDAVPYKDMSLVATENELSPYGHVNHLLHKLRLTESLLLVPEEFAPSKMKMKSKVSSPSRATPPTPPPTEQHTTPRKRVSMW